MTYQDKLRDPRWQKRRLEIFQRDFWTCVTCGISLLGGKQFHVDHKRYRPLIEPWESPDEDLQTLCEDCHASKHGKLKLFRMRADRMPMAVPTDEDRRLADSRREELKRILGVDCGTTRA